MERPASGTRILLARWRIYAIVVLCVVIVRLFLLDGARQNVLVLTAVMAALIVLAADSLRSRQGSWLYCETNPVRIGQPVRGHVHLRAKNAPFQEFWIVLRCMERPDPENAAIVIWQDEAIVESNEITRDQNGISVPFTFNMPTEGKPTGRTVKWILQVSARHYAAQFPLVVAEATGRSTVSDELLRPFNAVRDSLQRH